MLFNSFTFLFLFLPITAVGYFLLARRGHTWAAGWLALGEPAGIGQLAGVAAVLAGIAMSTMPTKPGMLSACSSGCAKGSALR